MVFQHLDPLGSMPPSFHWPQPPNGMHLGAQNWQWATMSYNLLQPDNTRYLRGVMQTVESCHSDISVDHPGLLMPWGCPTLSREPTAWLLALSKQRHAWAGGETPRRYNGDFQQWKKWLRKLNFKVFVSAL